MAFLLSLGAGCLVVLVFLVYFWFGFLCVWFISGLVWVVVSFLGLWCGEVFNNFVSPERGINNWGG